jgi:hypothetical protein
MVMLVCERLLSHLKRDGVVSVGAREPWFAVHYKLRAKDLLISLMRVSSRL